MLIYRRYLSVSSLLHLNLSKRKANVAVGNLQLLRATVVIDHPQYLQYMQDLCSTCVLAGAFSWAFTLHSRRLQLADVDVRLAIGAAHLLLGA